MVRDYSGTEKEKGQTEKIYRNNNKQAPGTGQRREGAEDTKAVREDDG
jgi:hypothetical protein